MKNIFIYGTLKRGFPNHDQKLLGKYYQCIGKSIEPYPLVIANQFYSPVLLDEVGVGKQVTGELYRVDNPTLVALDEIEGVGQNWGYHRTTIEVQRVKGGTMRAFAYMKYRKDLQVIHTEPLSFYALDARYVHPSMRT